MTTTPFLPYGRQTIDQADIDAVVAVLRSDWLTTGPAVGAFEQALAAAVGAAQAVAVSSGTAGLHLATLALGIGPGDTVVVPALTFAATANAPVMAGARVVFADVEAETGLIGPAQLEQALAAAGGPVKAVYPVHLAGQVADLPALAALAHTAGAVLIEDACHAVGSVVKGASGPEPVGACRHSALTVFSFHPVKTIAMGEGGAVTAADPTLAERVALLRSHGITRDPARFQRPELAYDAAGQLNPWYYEMQALGFNYRASDLHCALALSQLAKLGAFCARRAQLVAHYDRALAPLAPLVRPLGRVPGQRPGWHLYVALIDFDAAGVSRASVIERLRVAGIGSQVNYLPVPELPFYHSRSDGRRFPGAADYYRRALSLPLYPGLSDDAPERVAAALGQALRP